MFLFKGKVYSLKDLKGGIMRGQGISVIIPTYNREDVLGRSIRSVLNQTVSDIDLIIVDDGSTDGTRELVQGFMKEDSRVRYIESKENRGASAARNLGVSNASCDFIAFQDSDDEWFPHKLERQLQNNLDDVGICYCNYQMVSPEGKVFRVFPAPEKADSEKNGNIFFSLLKEACIGTPTILMKKKVFYEIGGFDESFSSIEDYEFSVRVAEKYPILHVDEVLMNVYPREGSGGQSVSGYFYGRIKMMERYYEVAREGGVLDAVYNEIINEAMRLDVLPLVQPMLDRIILAHGVGRK